MSDALRSWCARAWASTNKLPGGLAGALRSEWEHFAATPTTVVTLFGPYDSGKSSLLKRLLVDQEQPIPSWLTVSGRRETFELNEVETKGIVIRDTPGVSGGVAGHEEAAKRAVLLSDALVLVLPPQIMTSDRDAILSILSGSRFHAPTRVCHAQGGIIVVLSRMDEAGAMPRDDRDGYREVVARKRSELSSILHLAAVPDGTVAVHAIAADPFGLVGNGVPGGRGDYDTDRDWDGMGDLAPAIFGLSQRREELRVRAQVRFLGAELTSIAEALERMVADRETAAAAARNEVQSHRLAGDRLRAALGAARADLDRCIEEEIAACGRKGADDIAELRTAVLGRLEVILDQWMDRQDAEVRRLASETDADLKERRTRPAWRELASTLDSSKGASSLDSEQDETAGSIRKTTDRVGKVARILHRAFREAQPVTLGMSIEKARSELARLRNAASFADYVQQTSRGATRFKDAAHAMKASRIVIADVGFEVAVPAILELGSLVAEVWAEGRANKQRATLREKAREVIRQATGKLAQAAWTEWREHGAAAGLDEALKTAADNADAAAQALVMEREAMLEVRKELVNRLEELSTL